MIDEIKKIKLILIKIKNLDKIIENVNNYKITIE